MRNVLISQGGDDTLIPGSGYDIFRGGEGKDFLITCQRQMAQ